MKLLEQIRYKRNKCLYLCFEKILEGGCKNIPYALIKGDVLSIMAYKDVNFREYNDIDIIVPRSHLKKVSTILKSCGYIQREHLRQDDVLMLATSHQLFPFYCPSNYLTIDVNYDIFWGEYEGKRIDIEEFLSDTVEMQIYGVQIKTLPPIKTMVQLILHHYKDMNSIFLLATRKSIKYDMFKDIYYLLKNNLDSIPIDKLYAMSEEYDIIPYVFYVLYYTGQVFEDEVLKQYIDAFRTREGENLLNCYGLCAKERREWKCDFKTRLEADDLFELIKNDLTENDQEKIEINKKYFMGVSK